MTAILIPIALIGLVTIARRPEGSLFLWWAAINLLMLAGRIILWERFLIPLDVLIAILAGGAVPVLLRRVPSATAGRAMVTVGVTALAATLLVSVVESDPLISDADTAELQSLAVITEPGTLVMSTDIRYTPYVWGYSRRPTIAPDLLEYDRWSTNEWLEFREGTDAATKETMLRRYGGPIYIFVGDLQAPIALSAVPHVRRITERIWLYEPPDLVAARAGGVSDDHAAPS